MMLGRGRWRALGSASTHIINAQSRVGEFAFKRFLSSQTAFSGLKSRGCFGVIVASHRPPERSALLEKELRGSQISKRLASTSKKKKEASESGDLMEAQEQPESQLTVGAKVVQAGKDVTYLGIIIVGFAVTGALLWYVFSELFLGFSPNRVYSDALKKVLANSEVVEELGEPIMGHGEETRRGRRRHVSFQEYVVDGEDYMRIKFYAKGSKRKGTVHVDVKKGSRGSFIYRFIFVEIPDYPSRTIIILDNR
ncbi:predicted protein [Nematostella vectensis]|uniref:Mitochondrial import inner membrane translocase subunit Tim21 n=2 Tax=Nematostella vectensis TaxID=45351 RepID=A7SK73_NEMVE|nr:predicted protein [Nematostella vectensis]|eukprot:XP_001627968.1 predicted protein [Nematostella vectensis]